LLHAQRAAQALVECVDQPPTGTVVTPRGILTTVASVWDQLCRLDALYSNGEIPDLTSNMNVDLFNTLRDAYFPERYPMFLSPRRDRRGALTEIVRAHGGQGQTFVSTTRPGVTRGEHFHLRKVERFAVISGQARIQLRRLFSSDIVSFDVTWDEPCFVDMPTMWAHNITNVGDTDVTTLFWTNELFDPARSDTFPEPVAVEVLDFTGAQQ
jgi:UDP-2-acetamido-2,6-beta-L-arabino-hexul-4-ose reductase